MTIQINEFEIMVDEAPAPQARGTGDADEPAPQTPSRVRPEELASTLRVNRERMERVRAD